jgi:hypothetical protein
MNQVTVIIPTLCKSMFILNTALQTLNDHELVKEILVFDNTLGKFKSSLSKVTVFNDTDFKVNGSWNEGVEICGTEYYLLLNDDVVFNPWIIDDCIDVLENHQDVNIVTVATKEMVDFADDMLDDGEIIYESDPQKISLQGWFIMGRKRSWVPIDRRLTIFFGDNLIYLNALKDGGKIAKITSNFIYHATSTTVKAMKMYESGILQEEEIIFKSIIGDSSIKVLIGTPAYDLTLHAQYVESLIQTEALCRQKGITCQHIFICGDALVQRARNDIFKIAYDGGFDKLVFIDNDMFWAPEAFLKLIAHEYDIVGAPCRKKSDDNIDFNVTIFDKTIGPDDIMKVKGVGTGFLAVSRNAIKKLYESSAKYLDKGKNVETRMVFDVQIVDGDLFSEDIVLCKKWRDLGGEIYVDTSMTIGHVGEKNYIGNLKEFILATKDKNNK